MFVVDPSEKVDLFKNLDAQLLRALWTNINISSIEVSFLQQKFDCKRIEIFCVIITNFDLKFFFLLAFILFELR